VILYVCVFVFHSFIHSFIHSYISSRCPRFAFFHFSPHYYYYYYYYYYEYYLLDGKIKLWNTSSGFCYATLGGTAAGGSGAESSHTAPITAIEFSKSSVVLSASLDGTIKAHDLHRYRTFKTYTTPTPVQFLCLAIDPSGEIVCGGTMDPFHIYTWNIQTSRLLDVYTGHTGPVSSLKFQCNNGGVLASASWDGTVKLWDLYKDNVQTESLQHNSDIVCLTCSPNGKEICSGTIRGLLSFWDIESGKLKFELDGRRDIIGGRKHNDRMTASNNSSSHYFTSIAYSADGTCLLAGGNSKYVCIYEISQQILLKKFQVTFNRNLDGVLDEVRLILIYIEKLDGQQRERELDDSVVIFVYHAMIDVFP
jgi:periodic tryptophan protein 2